MPTTDFLDQDDQDIEGLDIGALKESLLALRAAIRLHRDERGHDRCWLDDVQLYSALPESRPADSEFVLPPRPEFLANCVLYHASRQPLPVINR